MTTVSTFKRTTRAAIAALIIGAASVSALPAQAAGDRVAFGFNFNSGNGVSFSIGTDAPVQAVRERHGRRQFVCMDNRQIRRGLRDYGFENIRFGGERRGRVHVEAEQGRWDYKMRVDRCDGEIKVVEKTRRHRDFRPGRSNGLQFQFNFR